MGEYLCGCQYWNLAILVTGEVYIQAARASIYSCYSGGCLAGIFILGGKIEFFGAFKKLHMHNWSFIMNLHAHDQLIGPHEKEEQHQ